MKPALTQAQAKVKDAYLRKHYNISLDQYNELREFQNYACYICQAPEGNFKNGMAVDHCHSQGTTRGLLCWHCNRALGKFKDNAEHLARAANYLNFPPTFVLWGKSPVSAPGRVGTKARAKLLAKLNGLPTPKRRAHSGKRKQAAKRARAKRA